MEKRYLAMWMGLCEGKIKVKITHFQLPSAHQKRACLSSLLSYEDNSEQLEHKFLLVNWNERESKRNIFNNLIKPKSS